MKIKFCGAAQEVTGSCHLLTLENGTKILLDCGLYQGGEDEIGSDGRIMGEFNETWLFNPKEIDVMILSHAHIDHCGRIPRLIRDGFKGRIYCTVATLNLCTIMLLDSAKIQESDAKNKNKRATGTDRAEALYTVDDVQKAMQQFVGIGYDRWLEVSKGISVLFRDMGHILGSSSVTLRVKEFGNDWTLGFTGDIGRPNRPILRDPLPLPDVDFLICESTYGDKLHAAPPAELEELHRIVHRACVERRGKLIIPAFSVGRTQEIVYMMDQLQRIGKLPKVEVYVDSPLAVNATHIFEMHPECFDEELVRYIATDSDPFGFKGLHYIRDAEQSKALNKSQEPCIIISASGMANAGRVKHHIFNSIDNPNNTILFVGYCASNTLGAILKERPSTVKIFGQELPVNASIETMDSFSAHGDQQEMFEVIKNQKQGLQKLFLVHGELPRQEVFKYFLKGNGFSCPIFIPKLGQEFDLF